MRVHAHYSDALRLISRIKLRVAEKGICYTSAPMHTPCVYCLSWQETLLNLYMRKSQSCVHPVFLLPFSVNLTWQGKEQEESS